MSFFRYDRAREITHRLQQEKREILENLLSRLETTFFKLRNVSVKLAMDNLDKQRKGLDEMTEKVYKVYNRFASWLL